MFKICSYSELPQQTTITNPSQFSVLLISCQLLYNISKSLLILLLSDACNMFSVTFECFMYSLYCTGCVVCTFMTYFTSYFHGVNSGPVLCVCVHIVCLCVCARACVRAHSVCVWARACVRACVCVHIVCLFVYVCERERERASVIFRSLNFLNYYVSTGDPKVHLTTL